jgi:hypothetical protein
MAVNDKIMKNFLKNFIAKSPVITSKAKKLKKANTIYTTVKSNKKKKNG